MAHKAEETFLAAVKSLQEHKSVRKHAYHQVRAWQIKIETERGDIYTYPRDVGATKKQLEAVISECFKIDPDIAKFYVAEIEGGKLKFTRLSPSRSAKLAESMNRAGVR